MVKFANINSYCPLAVYASDVINGIYSVDFGVVPVSTTIKEVTASASETVIHDFGEAPVELDTKYGRTVTVVSSGANTAPVLIHGFDYLGQPMVEKLVLNGTTAVNGKKAFKFIQSVEINNGAATRVTVKTGNILGLPYRTAAILNTTKNGVTSNEGTLVIPVNIAQTATTGDPRGTFSISNYTTAAHFVVVCVASPEIFTIDEKLSGGLQGIPHYFE